MCYKTQIKREREREKMEIIPYVLVIGSIMHMILCTRSDISYALSIMSRYKSNLGESYWKIVKNILKYIRINNNIFMIYEGHKLDASFQSVIDNKKS